METDFHYVPCVLNKTELYKGLHINLYFHQIYNDIFISAYRLVCMHHALSL